ncbi:hypothetical protein [Prauserella cavernicola]|uniref:Uncharacterized protein n=1 Tax=Prauserella cavernicola TaxID=2800127 RepID=A0A934V4K5_9PSEU|nr:hypothetical protein [Prauserella cavernicola]MBK1784809.1 hypothetical protein [Prauserella cavernicola]
MTHGHPQQPGGYPQNPGGYPQSGYGPQPPRKSKAGVVVAVVGLVAAVSILGITGFVAPGFLLGDDESGSSAAAATSERQVAPSTTSARTNGSSSGTADDEGTRTIRDFVHSLNAGDADYAAGLFCPEVRDGEEQVEEILARGLAFEADYLVDDDPALAGARVTGTGGVTASGLITATRENNGSTFCISTVGIDYR